MSAVDPYVTPTSFKGLPLWFVLRALSPEFSLEVRFFELPPPPPPRSSHYRWALKNRKGPAIMYGLISLDYYCIEKMHWMKNRVARNRLTHFEFEYCAGVIACRGWREGER